MNHLALRVTGENSVNVSVHALESLFNFLGVSVGCRLHQLLVYIASDV